MRTGRPPKEKETAIEWLKIYMSRGPVLVAQLKQNTPVGWKTIETAKKELGIRSKKTKQGWIWYTLDVTKLPQPNSAPSVSQPTDPADEPEESDGIVMDIQAMKALVDEMILDAKSYKEVERELITSCTAWPSNPPYSVDYIKRFAERRYNGLPVE